MSRRILYTGRFDIDSVDRRCQQGRNPSHHLHAVPDLRALGYQVDVFGTQSGEQLTTWQFQRRLWRAASGYDALIAHSLVEVNALAALRAVGLFGVPIVAFVHSAEGRSVQRYTARGADRVLAMNERAVQRLAGAGLKPPQLQTFDFGADLGFYHPRAQATEFVLSVGVSERDHVSLVEASRLSGVPVVIVGKLPDAVQASLPPQVQVLSQGNYDLSFDNLLDLYNRARLVVVSHFGTAHPIGLNAVVEALAMSKPLILTEGPGIDIDPARGGYGLRVPARHPQALAAALSDLFHADPARLRVMGQAARQAAESTYNSRRMAQDLACALQAVIR